MLSKYAEANAFNTSGTHNECRKWGQRWKAAGPVWEGQLEAATLCVMLILIALASAYFKSIGHPFFQTHWTSTYYTSRVF